MTNEITQHAISRRSFLAATAAFGVSHGLRATAQGRQGRVLAYVGTYTGAHGAAGHGEGIEQFEMDPHTGELSRRAPAVKTPNPSWLALHPSKKYLYAVNEVDNFDGGNGSVSAFAIDCATGALRPLNTVSSKGAIPAYCSVDAAGKFVFVANYGAGSIAVLPILANGSLGSAVDFHRDLGSVGSKHATDAPSGQFCHQRARCSSCAHDCMRSAKPVCTGHRSRTRPHLYLPLRSCNRQIDRPDRGAVYLVAHWRRPTPFRIPSQRSLVLLDSGRGIDCSVFPLRFFNRIA